jgi:hypothetical protein
MTTSTKKPAYTPKNAADLLTAPIIAAGPEVVALFTRYIETANAMHARKATKKQMQAAYRAYDLTFYAATHPALEPPTGGSYPGGMTAEEWAQHLVEYNEWLDCLPPTRDPLPEDF